MIYILIPSYRDLEMLSKCIKSVSNTLHEDYVLLVNYTDMRIGFPKAVNILFKSALANKDVSEIVLLSNDVEIQTNNWIQLFRDSAWSDWYPSASLVGGESTMLNPEKGWIFYVPHDQPPWYKESDEPPSKTYEVIHPPFSFCYFRREILEEVGLLDEKFGLGYYEDFDYGIRAWLKGYRSIVDPRVIYKHYRGYTMGKIEGFYPTEQAKYHFEKWKWLLEGRKPPEVLDVLKSHVKKIPFQERIEWGDD